MDKDDTIDTRSPKLRFPEFKDSGSWKVLQLGDCLLQEPDYGINAPSIPFNPDKPTYLRITDISEDGRFISENKVSVDKQDTIMKYLDPGDIVFARTGASVGKVYQYRVEDGPLVFAGYLIRIKPNPEIINSDYLFQYFFSYSYKKWVIATSTRSGQPGINSTEFSSLRIPVPSLPEQNRIAACFSSIDSLISALKEDLCQLNSHKKGLLQKLFPTSSKMLPEYRFPEFQNDGEWRMVALEDLFEIRNGYTPSKFNPEFWEGGTIPWFRMEDIRQNGHILSDSIQHITPQAVKDAGLFPAYSIIVATSATIGEHALILCDAVANQRFTFLTKRKSYEDKLDMMYFHQYMFIIDEWCKRNTNSGGLLSLNMRAFKRLSVPIPALTEQKKIASCLCSLDKMIEFFSMKANSFNLQKKGLLQQLFPHLQ